MKSYIPLFSLALALVLAVTGCSTQGTKGQTDQTADAVQGLFVKDIPFDGGDGLMIGWKPLPRDKRIQEYRIYRGISPDTLFYLTSVAVNVKTGVASDSMYFYDSGSSDFVDISSPGKLKYEKQKKNSILYRGIPRDMELAARLSEGFDLYSLMDDSEYYYKAKKAYSADKEDDTAYAGMRFNQQTIYASLKASRPGPESDPGRVWYYYTVVPVNERNQYLGIANPQKGYPVDDAPETSPALYCTALQDSLSLRFEWDLPVNKSDLAFYQIYLAPPVSDTLWQSLRNNPQAAAGLVPLTSNRLLKNYAAVPQAKLPAGISWERALASRYVIQFFDYSNNPSPLSRQAAPLLSSSKSLPEKAKYLVEDKINDKGDRLSVVWGQPIVFITKTTALDKEASKLKINYQLNKTDVQKVNNIYFEFFLPGSAKPFVKVNEFYQDNIIKIKVPAGYNIKDGLDTKITINTSEYTILPNGRISYAKGKLVENFELRQKLTWDPQMMALMPAKEVFRNGIDISEMRNTVYRKSFSGSAFTLVKKNTSYDNNLDVTIPYVASVGKPVLGFNVVKGDSLYTWAGGKRFVRKLEAQDTRQSLALVDSEIDLTFVKPADPAERGTSILTSVFADEARNKISKMKQDIEDNKKEIAAKQQELAALGNPAAAQALAAAIAQLTQGNEDLAKSIQVYEQNPEYKKMLGYKSNRGRMGFVASIREPLSRLQTYMMVKTNGKGLFTESYPEQNAQKDYTYFAAKSNWFDWNKLVTLIACIIFGIAVVMFVRLAKQGKDLYIRPIAGLQEIDNAIGRATEMGRPMLYCMGNGGLSDVATLASMGILGLVAKKAAEYDTKLIVPCYDYIVMPIAQEIVREAHYAVGRPDSYDKNNIFYLTSAQFAYVAGVNGIMIRERMATNFFMGYFAAEALLMTETGNAVGAVQIAGSDAITQIPFFITTCDYTLIGEELYAASAYLNREPMLLGTLKAQDYFKFLILVFVIIGAILATFQLTGLMQMFPIK